MKTWIPGPNLCFTMLWDLRVPTWRRELANLSILGDLISPDHSCWGGGGFDKCHGKKYLNERSKGNNFWMSAVAERECSKYSTWKSCRLQFWLPSTLEPLSQTFVNTDFFPVNPSLNGIPVQPKKLPGCALTLVPDVQCKKLSLLLWKAFLKGQHKAGMLWCLKAEVGIFPWEESRKAQMSGTLSCG